MNDLLRHVLVHALHRIPQWVEKRPVPARELIHATLLHFLYAGIISSPSWETPICGVQERHSWKTLLSSGAGAYDSCRNLHRSTLDVYVSDCCIRERWDSCVRKSRPHCLKLMCDPVLRSPPCLSHFDLATAPNSVSTIVRHDCPYKNATRSRMQSAESLHCKLKFYFALKSSNARILR